MHQKRIGGRIANELLMMFRMKKKTTKEVSLYDPIGTDKEGNEISLFDIIEGENIDLVEKMELQENVKKLYHLLEEVLNEREKKVIHLRYGVCGAEEMTQKEIAKQLGISRSYVSRIEKNALEKLKKRF